MCHGHHMGVPTIRHLIGILCIPESYYVGSILEVPYCRKAPICSHGVLLGSENPAYRHTRLNEPGTLNIIAEGARVVWARTPGKNEACTHCPCSFVRILTLASMSRSFEKRFSVQMRKHGNATLPMSQHGRERTPGAWAKNREECANCST